MISPCTTRRVDRRLLKDLSLNAFIGALNANYYLYIQILSRNVDIFHSVARRFSSPTVWKFHSSCWWNSCDSYCAASLTMWSVEILDSFHSLCAEAERKTSNADKVESLILRVCLTVFHFNRIALN